MKKLFSIAAIVMIGALAFTSCKKSDSSSSNGSIKGTAGSTSFSTNYCSASYSAIGDSILTISGLSVSTSAANIYPYVGMILHWNGATGSITLGSQSEAVYYKDMNTQYEATSGTVTITSVSPTQISGTYSFEAASLSSSSDSIAITNGSFTAKGTSL